MILALARDKSFKLDAENAEEKLDAESAEIAEKKNAESDLECDNSSKRSSYISPRSLRTLRLGV